MAQCGTAVERDRRRPCTRQFFNRCCPQCTLDARLGHTLLSGLQGASGFRRERGRRYHHDGHRHGHGQLRRLGDGTATDKSGQAKTGKREPVLAGAGAGSDQGISQKQFYRQRVSPKTSTYFAKVAVNGSCVNQLRKILRSYLSSAAGRSSAILWPIGSRIMLYLSECKT